jgi:hypothetical protein
MDISPFQESQGPMSDYEQFKSRIDRTMGRPQVQHSLVRDIETLINNAKVSGEDDLDEALY